VPQHCAVCHGDGTAFDVAGGERSRVRGYQRRRDQDRGAPGVGPRRYGRAQRDDRGGVHRVSLPHAPDHDEGIVWRLPRKVGRLAPPPARSPHLPVAQDAQEGRAEPRQLAPRQGINRRELQVGRGQHQVPPPAVGVPADRRPSDDDRDTDHYPANFAHGGTISARSDIRAGLLSSPQSPDARLTSPFAPSRH